MNNLIRLSGRASLKLAKNVVGLIQKTDSREIVLRSEVAKKDEEIEKLKKAWPGLAHPQSFQFASPRPSGDLLDGDAEVKMDVMRFNAGGVEVALGGKPDEYEKEEKPTGRGRRKLVQGGSKTTEKLRLTDAAFQQHLIEMFARGWLQCCREGGMKIQDVGEKEVLELAALEAEEIFSKILRGQK